MIQKFEAWKGLSKFHMACTLGVSMNQIDEWSAGATALPLKTERFITVLFSHLCGDYARWMIENLGRWDHTETQIAHNVGVSPSQIHRWREKASPRLTHVIALENYYCREHNALLVNWLCGRAFRFLGSKADVHVPNHERLADNVLAQSLAGQVSALGPTPGPFPLLLEVRFEELPRGVHANTHIRETGTKPVFQVVINRNESRREQERVLFIEIDGHVLDYFRDGKAGASAPRRLLRCHSKTKPHNKKDTS